MLNNLLLIDDNNKTGTRNIHRKKRFIKAAEIYVLTHFLNTCEIKFLVSLINELT